MSKLLLSALLLLSTPAYSQTISPDEARKLSRTVSSMRKDTSQISVLLKLAKYHVFKPGENKTDLDSAAVFIKQAENINATVKSKWASGNILLISSYQHRESGERDKGKQLAEQAVAILKDEVNKNLAGEAYMELSGYYVYNDPKQLEQRIELVKSAINYYTQAGNIKEKAASLQMLGDLQSINGTLYLALQSLQASLDAYKSINHKQLQGIYCLMGFIHSRQREFRKALDMELLALQTAEATGDSSMQLCQIYNYLGEISMGIGEKEKAADYYSKASDIAKRHNDHYAIYLASVNTATAWASFGHPRKALAMMKELTSKYEKPKNFSLDYKISQCYISCYSLLTQFDKARPYVNQLLEIIDKAPNNTKVSIYTVVITFFIRAGEANKAKLYIDKHDEIANEMKDIYYRGINTKLRIMLDTAQHNYKSAMERSVEFAILQDSLHYETRNKQIAELQVQFETERKEQAIITKDKDIQLLTKQTQLQESRIEKNRLLRNFMIAGAALLLLILALVIRAYIIKKKNNRILRRQQALINDQNISLQTMVREQEKLITEKEWLLKEIHHRVKNNLQIVMSLLNSQSAYIDNEPALIAIHNSQHRVQAMSLIHQKLYGSENVSSIDMSFYIRELVSYLADSFSTGSRIHFDLSVEQLEMDVSQAVPLGLILNEAITNAIKYAFPYGGTGVIAISLVQDAPHHYQLTIADNGVGMPSGINKEKAGSLGMSLMMGLTEDLGGDFSIDGTNGTTINISFVHELAVKRGDMLSVSN